MNVRFSCPACGQAVRVDHPGNIAWQCPACDHLGTLQAAPPAGLSGGAEKWSCAVCGNRELYRKKDFPHALGLTILTLACVGSIIPYWLYMQWLSWTILIGSAVVDALLYLAVGDVVVCYRCEAHHRGFAGEERFGPFELTVNERYRQEKIRSELASQK